MLGYSLRTTAQSTRFFSSSSLVYDHYETLGVPRTASKMAIKSRYYKLSKIYHPDVNTDDQSAKSKFQAVSEAYSVLGDDRRRRGYDRELAATGSGNSSFERHAQAHPQRPHYYYDPSSMYETRRRGASHAWENARRTRQRTSNPPSPPPFTQRPFGGMHRSGTAPDHEPFKDPFSNLHVRRATGRRTPFETREDNLKKEPVVTRIAQVLGLVFFIVAITGGFHSSRVE